MSRRVALASNVGQCRRHHRGEPHVASYYLCIPTVLANMTNVIQCPGCSQRYQVGIEMAGKRLKCKKCGTILTIPAAGTKEPNDSELRVADLLEDDLPSPISSPSASAPTAPPRSSENPYEPPASATPARRRRYRLYENVPWYRMSSTNTIFVLVGWFLFPPLLWWTCINLVTGDVYYNETQDGELKKWSKANKVVAVILLLLNILFYVPLLIGLASLVIRGHR